MMDLTLTSQSEILDLPRGGMELPFRAVADAPSGRQNEIRSSSAHSKPDYKTEREVPTMSAERERIEYLVATSTAEQFLELGKVAGVVEIEPGPVARTANAARRSGG